MPLITSRPKIKTTVDGSPLAYQLFTEGNYVPLVVEVERTTITDDLTDTVVVFSASGGNGQYYISKTSEYPSQVSLISITSDRIKALVKLVKEDTLFYLDDVTNFRYSVGLRSDLGLMELESGYFNVNPSLALGKDSQAQIPDSPPLIELIAPKTEDKLYVNKSFKLMAKASDIGGGVSKVDFYANDIKIGTNNAYSTKGVWDFKYTPTQAGAVVFYAIATDTSLNATKSNSVAVVVEAEPVVPTANFSFSPLTGSAPLEVTFVNTSVNAVSYSWNFGDNTAASTAIAPTHTYQASGNYTITLTATNQYGSTTITKTLLVTVNQPPTVSITSPTNNTTIPVGQQIAVTASASDPGGAIASVEFKVGTTSIGSKNTAPYSVNWTPTSAGTFQLTAIATDDKAVTTTSSAVAVNVPSPPTVSLTSPSNNSNVVVGQPVTLTASATASTGTTLSGVQFKVNGTNLGSPVTSAPFTTTWTPTVAGTYSLTATVTDSVGAIVTSTAVTATAATNQSPTVTVTSPNNNASINLGQAQTLTATASDIDGSVASVQFKVNGTNVGSAITSAPYSVSWTPTAPGAANITAVATDNLGATTTSAAVAVTVANQSPTITITSPNNGATVTTTSGTTLTATASDPDGTIASVQFKIDGVNFGSPITSAPYTLSWTPTTTGSHAITAVATDNFGATTTSATVTVTATNQPTPTVTASAPKAGLINEAQTLAATATISGDTIASVQFKVDTVNQGAADTTSPYSTQWTPTTKGSYSITAVALGALGGSTTSAAVVVPIYDTKVNGGGNAAGTSLGAVAQDFILFDNNQAAGGNAATMSIFVSGVQVGAFNYGDSAYNGRPFAFFNSANNTLYTTMTNGNPATIQSTVNFG